jgi:hypothetical protein
MLDFMMISTRSTKKNLVEVYPKFIINKTKDLMIRGGDFYAIWNEDTKLWSTDEHDALKMIDRALDEWTKENKSKFDCELRTLHMWDASSGMIDSWHKYCQKQMRDNFRNLDERIVFANEDTKKEDYASKKITYPLEKGITSSYDKLISTLYSNEERHKIEWAIGSIVCGASKNIQKFLVLYGDVGSGKSTILNIIQDLFEGYYSVFDAKALGSANNSFALESFKSNPLVAIQHDGDLSRLEDNTRLNSLVSHELMTVNEKFKSAYANRFNSFLFMGTNKPVKITDAKSGLIRRLIDVTPTGNKLPSTEYKRLVKQIKFELGAIAYHCKEVYLDNPSFYDNYIPISMLGASNDFYNFVLDNYYVYKNEDETTLKASWEMYKTYCDYAKVNYPLNLKAFKEELKTYFKKYADRYTLADGTRARNYYSIFREDRFENNKIVESKEEVPLLNLSETKSSLDILCKDLPSQYASDNEIPMYKWEKVKTKLKDIDTSKLHYLKLPINHIVIDFDLKDKEGNKSLELNLKEASKFPATYAEVSKGGAGIHLHYIYDGEVESLSRIYSEGIEIKVFTGNSALRRKLTKCNNLSVNTINSGLPLRKDIKMINFDCIKTEKSLRELIKRNLNKEIHAATKPSIDFIHKILEDAYSSDIKYDVTDMRNAIIGFAARSTNQSEYCLKLVTDMKFKSDEISQNIEADTDELVFFDIEIFPNLFIVVYKKAGEDNKPAVLINPNPTQIVELTRHKLIGFNCRRYDNHILYASIMGYTNEQLYKLSQRIINNSPNSLFGEAYNLSYTDVYDFSSKKQSLKKFEIELGISHKELGLKWDEPVPEDLWETVADYCINDVLATEAVFNDRKADFIAREILADVAQMTVNDTTNSLTTKIIFGSNRHPQDSFNYRFMGLEIPEDRMYEYDDYTIFDKNGKPLFPNYRYEFGKSMYRGEEIGEGGYVYAEPGMYGNVALLDVASMHPSSIIAENLFGDEYTKRFEDIVKTRLAIKHKDFDTAKKLLGGVLAKYLTDEDTAKALAGALKIAINSVYGLTSASFEHPFKDPRNIDNIVAKRGALFMVNLKHEVMKRGFKVAHIKTDSIKIPDATSDIIDFVIEYGKKYGYTFEHEATYEKMCLVNDAVYIAKYKNEDGTGEWTATGTQFAVPFVFKSLFSKETIIFKDLCETKSVTTSLYLDFNEKLEDVFIYEKELEARERGRKINKELVDLSNEDIKARIAKGHNYKFIGKVGLFCPIIDGAGGGILLRGKYNKYSAVTGTKGYRWLEAEVVKNLQKGDEINKEYYYKLVDAAVQTLSLYGDYERFISDEPYIGPKFVDGKPVYEEGYLYN